MKKAMPLSLFRFPHPTALRALALAAAFFAGGLHMAQAQSTPMPPAQDPDSMPAPAPETGSANSWNPKLPSNVQPSLLSGRLPQQQGGAVNGRMSAANTAQFQLDKEPDPHKLPILAEMMAEPDSHIFPLGHMYDLDGWFMYNKQNQIQVFYTGPGGRSMLIGALFDAQGQNITGQQVIALRDREPEIARLFSQAAENVAQEYQQRATGTGKAPPAANLLSPGEKLLKEMTVANWIVIGKMDAPAIYMVVDPRCPHCKTAWNALASYVNDGKIQIRIMPVDILDGGGTPGESKRLSADLIAAPDPTAVWKKMVSGDSASITEQPSGESLAKVDFNRSLFDRWKMPSTPYFIYRSKDGSVKVLDGEPEDVPAFIADLAPG